MDTSCLKSSLSGITPAISINGSLDVRTNPSQVSVEGRTSAEKTQQKTIFSRFSFKYPLRSFWPGGGGNGKNNGLALDDAVLVEHGEGKSNQADGENGGMGPEYQRENWVLKILHVRSLWREEQGNGRSEQDARHEEEEGVANNQINSCDNDDQEQEEEVCDACRVDDDDEEEIHFDRDSFSRLLRRVSLAEARLYGQMSYLGNLAYSIPKINPGNLLKYHGLRFVMSSIEKKELAQKAEKNQVSAETHEVERSVKDGIKIKEQKNSGYQISSSAAYQIAASAASYLHSRTRSILPFKPSKADGECTLEGSIENSEDVNMMKTEMASFMATTDSSPCEWFICDDDESGTRFFAIQGSETLASWKANLLFEPIHFEGLDVLVHRGIYEAAKGIYEQMLPEIHDHLKSCGDHANFRFTGHSLRGKLGNTSDNLLAKIGLPRSHVQAITMHRDIVPRAFSCNYPNHVAEILKAVNGSFRNHPCLNNQKLLYAPVGELLILQPDEKFSPSHHLLPSGSGLYLLSCPLSEPNDAEKQLRAAQLIFLNSPHPLEILSDRSAYGSEGTIQRDHDMKSYLKSVRSVIRQELNLHSQGEERAPPQGMVASCSTT
ncbi:Lipase [Quillaja saponaria]|uniref:Lipase n=1 Tax=Quillaja saponaria TaxID=32244 RepID=A0AAD7VEN7_QUISA|nr:Lipase [Quillaja saponaria]